MLSKLNGETFTIINQIPRAANIATKVEWKKHRIHQCNKQNGIVDKSTGTMMYNAHSYTAYLHDWEHYRPPTWFDNGYYSMDDFDKSRYYTANVGDFIIFADIPDTAPTTTAEFTALTQKYKDIGGIIDGANVHINFKPNGKPWPTNHIELIGG